MFAVLVLLAGTALISAVHELGHAVAAKLLGLHITDICLGLGPPIVTIKRGDIRILLAPIPLGGFVRVTELSPDYRRTDLSFLPSVGRLAVIAAGPAANYLFASLVAFTLVLGLGVETGGGRALKVVSVDAGTAPFGLIAGDLVVQVNGRPVADLRSLSLSLEAGDGDAVVTVDRKGQSVGLRLPRHHARSGAWGLGAAYTIDPEIRRAGLGEAVVYAVANPLRQAASWSARALAALKTSPTKARPLGIVGLADRVHASTGWTWRRRLALAISLSVAMGLFNLLPFPGLDGGRLCFEGVQSILRRQWSTRWLYAVQVVGGLLLLVAWIALTAFEIFHL
jgi:regulator of sigma E protease